MDNGMFFALIVVISFFGWRISRLLRELIDNTRKNTVPYWYIDQARKTLGYEKESNANYWLLLTLVSLLSDGDF